MRALNFAVVLLLPACATTPSTHSAADTAVYTVDGRVVGVDDVPPDRQLSDNIRITVRADSQPVVVELAPGWVLDERGLHFNREDAVQVSGVLREDGSVRAHRVRKRDGEVILRHDDGSPVWINP